jgi:hypothetical protein
MSMHYFSCLGGTSTDSTKTRRDTLHGPLFLHPSGSVGHIVQSGACERDISRHYFSCWVGPIQI